jgi:hypothetical protein
MTKMRNLNYGDRLPEMVMDSLMEYISTYAGPNFSLSLSNPTTLQVVAGADNAQAAVGISGRWRYNSATVNAAHPGGAGGSYDIYVTASDNNFVPSGLPPGQSPETDNTVYSFGLQILPTGSTPTTALYRKVGTCTWSGSAITDYTQTVGGTKLPAQASDGTPAMDGTAARGSSPNWARADHVHPIDSSRAPLASPALTGTPVAPPAAVDTNTTQIATTAFVLGQAAAATPLMNGAAAVGTSTRYARADHVHPIDTSRAPLANPVFTGGVTAPLFVASGANSFQGSLPNTSSWLLNATIPGQGYSIFGVFGQILYWSDTNNGGHSNDVNLYRGGNNVLQTDSNFTSLNRISGNEVYAVGRIAGNSGVKETFLGDVYGDNGVPGLRLGVDTNLYRSGAGALKTDGSLTAASYIQVIGSGYFAANNTTAGAWAFEATVSGETQTRFVLHNTGTMEWGSGSAAIDTNLYRASANALKTDGALQVTGQLLAGWTGSAWTLSVTSGSATVPTAAVDTNSTQIATTAFVIGQAASATPLMNGAAAVGTSTRFARADHVHPSDTSRAPLASPSFTGTIHNSGDISVAQWIRANASAEGAGAGQNVIMGYYNGVQGAGISFGTDGSWDAWLYRSAAGGNLRTNSSFWADGSVVVAAGGAGTLYVGSQLDTYMNRNAAGQLGLANKLIEGNAAITNIGATTTFTPNLSNGLIHRVAATSGAAITLTIGAPTNPPVSSQTALLVIHIGNSSPGTITIAWNAVFQPGSTLALPSSSATGTTREVLFVWDGANWRIVAIG